MYHYLNDARNIHGEVLTGFFVRAVDASTNAGATLYADESLTPIVSLSGIADAALVDDSGSIDFYIGIGTYHLDFYAPDGTTFVKRIRNVPMTQNIFDTTGVFTATPNGVGYSTGNGSSVTQATSKVTTVTLNKPSGRITMNNSAITNGTSLIFNFSNSCVVDGDQVLVTLGPLTGALFNYRLAAGEVANGGCRISLTNTSGGTLSEAVPINFMVLKGVYS